MSSTTLELVVANDLARVPTPLTEKNISDWKYYTDIALSSGGVWEDFFEKDDDGNRKDPPTDVTQLVEWNRRKAAACNWIRKAAGREHETTIEPFIKSKDPAGMRDALIALYQTQSASSRFKCWLDITHFTRNSNEDYTSVFARVDALIQQLERLTPESHSVEEMRKEVALFTCLSTVDTKHPFHATIAGDQTLTYKTFKEKVRSHESTCIDPSDKLQNGAVVSAFMSRMMEQASLAGNYDCYWCGEEGHSIIVCDKMKSARSKWQAAQSHSLNPTIQFHPQSSNQSSSHQQSGGNGNRNRGRGRGRCSQGRNNANSNSVHTASESVNTASTEHMDSPEFAGQASSSRPPSQPLSNSWLADSGASCHMTPREDWVFDKVSFEKPVRLADGSIINSTHKGVVRFIPLMKGASTLEFDVLLVPLLNSNLFSWTRFSSAPNQATYCEGDNIEFLRNDKLLFTATIAPSFLGYLNVRPIAITPIPSESANAALDIHSWHCRCGHRNYDSILKMIRDGSIKDLDLSSAILPDTRCVACLAGKMTKGPHTQLAPRATGLLERVHTDVKGPIRVQGRHGERYWVTFIDNFSGRTVVYFLSHKSQVFAAFKDFSTWAKNQMNRRILEFDEHDLRLTVKKLRDDKGGEYISKELDAFCKEHGIDRECTQRDTPQQNGVAERFN